MHLHTDHSDGAANVGQLLRQASAQGFGVAVTDHNQVSGAVQAFQERGEVLVVPGIEVSAADGPHILAYFYSAPDLQDFYRRHVAPSKRSSPWLAIRSATPELAEALSGYPCLAVAAHPYGYMMFNKGLQKCIDAEYLPADIRERFDGFEVLCGGMAHALNVRAVEAAWDLGLCFTGGTDAHTLPDYGGVVTCARAHDLDSFLREVEGRRNLVVGEEKDPFMKALTGTVMVGKHSRYFFPSMRVHFEQNLPRVPHYFQVKLRRFREDLRR
jgi:hypothetical protein